MYTKEKKIIGDTLPNLISKAMADTITYLLILYHITEKNASTFLCHF